MQFMFEANLQYSSALKRAQKMNRKRVKLSEAIHPKRLNAFLNEGMVAEKTDLGVMEIPMNMIAGIADEAGKELYSPDFLPLSPVKSAYADKWCSLYQEYKEDKAFVSPIYCYEYLGEFYVIDGKKRVSILKCRNALVTKAYVIRLVPAASEEKRIKLYEEFVEYFKLTGLYQVRFSQNDCFIKLQAAMGHEPDQIWNDEERAQLLNDLKRSEEALKEAFGGYLNVTPADALLVLLEDHSFEQVREMAVSVMADRLQIEWKKLYRICHPDIDLYGDKTGEKAS